AQRAEPPAAIDSATLPTDIESPLEAQETPVNGNSAPSLEATDSHVAPPLPATEEASAPAIAASPAAATTTTTAPKVQEPPAPSRQVRVLRPTAAALSAG